MRTFPSLSLMFDPWIFCQIFLMHGPVTNNIPLYVILFRSGFYLVLVNWCHVGDGSDWWYNFLLFTGTEISGPTVLLKGGDVIAQHFSPTEPTSPQVFTNEIRLTEHNFRTLSGWYSRRTMSLSIYIKFCIQKHLI